MKLGTSTKLSTALKNGNVLSLIRGNSAPATNISADLTLPTSNDTTDDTTGKADITRERFDTLRTNNTNNTAPDELLYVTDGEPVIVNLDVANFSKNFVTDDTPTTDGDNTPDARIAELDAVVTNLQSKTIDSVLSAPGNAAQAQVNRTLSLLDDTNASTTANINLPDYTNTSTSANWGDNQQSDLLDDASTTFTGTTSLPQMDLDSITQPSSAGTMPDVADELTKATKNDQLIANAKALVEQANQQSPGRLNLLQ